MGAATTGSLEGGEIVLSHEGLKGGVHGLFVEAEPIAMPAPGAEKQVGATAVVDRVAVAPVASREAGVPLVAYVAGRPHPDRGRQAAIERFGPAFGWNRSGRIKVHHLSSGMDATVGAPSGHAANRTVRIEGPDRGLQHLLHTELMGLALPAMIARTLVLEAERDPAGRGSLQRRGFGEGAGEQVGSRWVQTSSMMAISALSPRRRMVRMMRV